MGRGREAPDGFVCSYRDRCPHLDGLSAFGVFQARQSSCDREHEHWRIREALVAETTELRRQIREQAPEIEQLRAENRLLHQRGFKFVKRPAAAEPAPTALPRKPRGAPRGHPAWKRKVPENIDQTVHIEAPLFCPHCQSATDPSDGGQTSYVQKIW